MSYEFDDYDFRYRLDYQKPVKIEALRPNQKADFDADEVGNDHRTIAEKRTDWASGKYVVQRY